MPVSAGGAFEGLGSAGRFIYDDGRLHTASLLEGRPGDSASKVPTPLLFDSGDLIVAFKVSHGLWAEKNSHRALDSKGSGRGRCPS